MSGLQIQEHAEEVVVKTAVPGLNANELDIGIKDDVLIIKAQRAQQDLDICNAVNCCQVQGRFERLVHLPHGVEHQFADAVVEDGVLTITLPKAQTSQTWSIEVRTA
jgi:HSP20 family protein